MKHNSSLEIPRVNYSMMVQSLSRHRPSATPKMTKSTRASPTTTGAMITENEPTSRITTPKRLIFRKSQDNSSMLPSYLQTRVRTKRKLHISMDLTKQGHVIQKQTHNIRQSTTRKGSRFGFVQAKTSFVELVEEGWSEINQVGKDNSLSVIQVLQKLISYSIDLDLPKQMGITILYLGESYFAAGKLNEAVHYYNQARVCFSLRKMHGYLIDSLIGLARCCSKCYIFQEGLIYLSKALECAFYSGDRGRQLLVYDQMGVVSFRMGKLEDAKKYHDRFMRAGYQKDSSLCKIVAKTKFTKNLVQQEDESGISLSLLISLVVPVKPVRQLPSIQEGSMRQDYYTCFSAQKLKFQETSTELKKIIANNADSFYRIPDIAEAENQRYSEIISECASKYLQLDRQLNQRLISYSLKRRRSMNASFKARSKSKPHAVSNVLPENQPEKYSQQWQRDLIKRLARDRDFNIGTLQNKILIKNVYTTPPKKYSLLSVYQAYYLKICL